MKDSAREGVSEIDGGRETHNSSAALLGTEHPGVEIGGRKIERGDDVDSGSTDGRRETKKHAGDEEKRHTLLIRTRCPPQ
jgi:hypothetical protein